MRGVRSHAVKLRLARNVKEKNMKAHRTLLTAILTATACCGAVTAFAGTKPPAHTPTIYVNQDATHIEVYKGDHSYSIAGKDTAMYSPIGLAVQALGDVVYSNREGDQRPGTIVTLPPGKGDVTAKYIIKCKDLTPWGVSIDADSNIWMTNYETNEVRQYAANANGCPAPLTSIKGPHTQLDNPQMAVVDSKGRIVVSNYLTGIVIFAPGAHGDATPIANITNPKIISAHIEGMAVDRKDNIWVTSYAKGQVYEFAPDANGTDAPKRTLAGRNTKLYVPIGIAIDRRTGEIYIADYGTHAVLVFAPDANGNVAPIRTFAGGFDYGVALK
jgi:DNA-binding beta-propeller fold protein YncE